LTGVSFTTFQDGFPASELILEVYGTDGEGKPSGAALSSHSLAAASLGWSPRRAWAAPGIKVEAGKRYALVMRSATSQGCYGMAYRDAADGAPPAGAVAGYTSDGGATWRIEAGRTLKFETRIAAPTAIAERMAKMRARAMAVRTGGSVDAKGARGEGGVRFRAVTAE
jgi:hypothetical protein